MRTKTLFSTLVLVFFISFSTNAQVNINVNINSLPDWAPYEYIPETRYYYIPEIEVYYDIPAQMYIYYHRNGWIRSNRLPKKFRHFNMINAYKVSLFDIGPNPYVYYSDHRIHYPRHYNRGYHQPTRYVHRAPAVRHNLPRQNQSIRNNGNGQRKEYVNPQNYRAQENRNSNRNSINSDPSRSRNNIDRNSSSNRGRSNTDNRINSSRSENNVIRR